MLAILRRYQTCQKVGCRYMRKFKILDGKLSLAQEQCDSLLSSARKTEEIYKEKLSQVLEGKIFIFLLLFNFYLVFYKVQYDGDHWDLFLKNTHLLQSSYSKTKEIVCFTVFPLPLHT